MKKAGVCPVSSDSILRFAVSALDARGAFQSLLSEKLIPLAGRAGSLMPDYCFPDVYLEQSLLDRESCQIGFVLDSYDRNYLRYITDGEYFSAGDLPAFCAPGDYSTLLTVLLSEAGVSFSGIKEKLLSTELLGDPAFYEDLCAKTGTDGEDLSGPAGFLHFLAKIPVRFHFSRKGKEQRLFFTSGKPDLKQKFTGRDYRGKILSLLEAAGCTPETAAELGKACFNCGVPYYSREEGYLEWITSLDAAYFAVIWEGNRICDCRVGVRITDRSLPFTEIGLKPSIAFQWHITDNCDQRCKHCYLFGEDAGRTCMNTSWDQLLHTLNELESDARRRNLRLILAVSGGDPILHPQFWELAEEIRRRGIHWSIMGNPFHLNPDVCRRLKQAGVYKYQLSLDGLEAFHDRLRKPGSYRATLEAVSILNDAGIQTQFMATASRENLDDILACMDIAVEHQVSSFTFARYCATSKEKAKELYPSPEEYRAFLLQYYRKLRAFEAAGCKTRFRMKEHLFTLLRWELGDFTVPEYAKRNPDRVYDGCHLGFKPTILPNGDLLACRRMESKVGNSRTDSVTAVTDSARMKEYRDVKNISKCRDCELLNWCRGCRAVGFNATGDLQAADPCCWK